MSETEPYTQTMRFLDVEAEIVMMSFKDASESSIKRLKSTLFTGAWVNECQFAVLRLVTEIIDRTGRYPRRIDCPDYDRRKFAVLDCNAPMTHDHWLLYMRGDTPIPPEMSPDQAMAYKKPDNWEFFMQPPAVVEDIDQNGNLVGYALNMQAENLQNMGDDPYLPAVAGKERDQIDRDFRNITRTSRSGAPRYPRFDRDLHVAEQKLEAYEGSPIIIGMDPGGEPGAVFGQNVDNRWYILHSEVAVNCESSEFAAKIKHILATRFPFHRDTGIVIWCDPAGGWGSINSRSTTQQIFAAAGMQIQFPATKDNPGLRLSTGRNVLDDYVRGQPKVVVCPEHCRELINALDGGMRMKQRKIEGSERVTEDLIKNEHSHVGEAFEYLLWGGGEAREMLQRPEGSRPARINTIPKRQGSFNGGRSWSSIQRSGAIH